MSDRTPFFSFGPQVPYYSPAPAVQSYNHVPQQAQQLEPPMLELTCDLCEGRIDSGEEVVELFLGVAGRSPQTGYLTTVPNPRYVPHPGQVAETTTVHRECHIEHAMTNVNPEQADDLLAEQVMELANELFEEWKQNYLLEERFEERISDPDA